MNFFISLLLFLIFAKLITKYWLENINIIYTQKNKNTSVSFIDEKTLQKSVHYSIEKHQFGKIQMVFDSFILFFILAYSFLPISYIRINDLLGQNLLTDVVYLLSIGFLLAIPAIPFDWWGQFKIEEKYGFNKSSKKLWIMDKVKGTLVSLIISVPLLMLLLTLVNLLGNSWWIWGASLLIGFQLLMMVLYPKLIMPLFNKFSPLPEGELKEKLLSLAKKTDFGASTIQVIDGSKRSAHSNAFFTGFGRFRKIILFDTLIQQLNPDEIEAVLAHEIGHYKKGHIPKKLAFSFVMTFFTFGLIAYLIKAPWFYSSFGFNTQSLAPALLLFSLFSGLFTFWWSPLFNYFSRKNEYEADAYAKEITKNPVRLVDALKKLTEKNLSNINPHPFYSTFYYSHPTLKEREAALLQT